MNTIRCRILVLGMLFISCKCLSQNCSGVSGKKNKEEGTEAFTALITSKEFYTLLISKIVDSKNPSKPPAYSFYLSAASKVLLSDSMLNTPGEMTLWLLDNTSISLENVKYYNNPLGFCCSLGFEVNVAEEHMRTLANNPIITLEILSLRTTFAGKKQKDLSRIITCLINKN